MVSFNREKKAFTDISIATSRFYYAKDDKFLKQLDQNGLGVSII